MDQALQRAIEEYKAKEGSLTEKEKAVREAQIWNLRGEGARGQARETWLFEHLGISKYDSTYRQRLLGMGGSDFDRLWALVDDKQAPMAVRTASELQIRAKRRSVAERIPLKQALDEIIAEYESRPTVQFLQGGKVLRKGKPTLQLSSSHGPQELEEEEEIVESVSDNFFAALQKSLGEYVDRRTGGASDPIVDELKQQFMVELKTLVSSFQSRLQNAVSRGKKRITYQEVCDACEVLYLDPPDPNQLPDMEQGKKKFRGLARAYHPDTGGNERTKQSYQKVVEAWSLLQDFEKQFKTAAKKGLARGQV